MAVCKAERRGSDLKLRRSMMCIHLFLENIMCAWCIRAGGELIPLRVVRGLEQGPNSSEFPIIPGTRSLYLFFYLFLRNLLNS